MSDSSSKLSSFFAKKQGKTKFKAVKINLSSVSAVRMDEEDELDAQASLEANPRAAELISSAGWVADVDDNVGPVVHAGSKTVVGFSAADSGNKDDDEDDSTSSRASKAQDDDVVLHPMDMAPEDDDSGSDDEDDSPASANNPSSSSSSSSALPAKFSKKSGWGVPTPTPAASKTEELSKSQFPTLAAAKAVAEAQAEAGGEDGFNVVGSRRARRGPASMSSSGSGGGRSYSDRRGGNNSRGGWTDTRPDHLRLRTSNQYDMLS